MPEMLTFKILVKDVAGDYGRTVTDDEAAFILWNHTGFPGFFQGDPLETCAKQIDHYFALLARGCTCFSSLDDHMHCFHRGSGDKRCCHCDCVLDREGQGGVKSDDAS